MAELRTYLSGTNGIAREWHDDLKFYVIDAVLLKEVAPSIYMVHVFVTDLTL
jgi:hypothetical protein